MSKFFHDIVTHPLTRIISLMLLYTSVIIVMCYPIIIEEQAKKTCDEICFPYAVLRCGIKYLRSEPSDVWCMSQSSPRKVK